VSYYVVNKHDRATSAFYPNDCKQQLHFHARNAYTFRTIEEAEDFIAYVQCRCNAKTRPAADQLRVSTYAVGWPT